MELVALVVCSMQCRAWRRWQLVGSRSESDSR
jgi:hypothetical protein